MPGGPPKAKMVIDAPTKKSVDSKLAKDQQKFHDHAAQMEMEAKMADQCIQDSHDILMDIEKCAKVISWGVHYHHFHDSQRLPMLSPG